MVENENYETIKARYLLGASIAQLAQEHGLKQATLKQYSRRHGWHGLKQQIEGAGYKQEQGPKAEGMRLNLRDTLRLHLVALINDGERLKPEVLRSRASALQALVGAAKAVEDWDRQPPVVGPGTFSGERYYATVPDKVPETAPEPTGAESV